jgi:hypothetical protein
MWIEIDNLGIWVMTELQTIIISAAVGAIVATLGQIITYLLNQQSVKKQVLRDVIDTDMEIIRGRIRTRLQEMETAEALTLERLKKGSNIKESSEQYRNATHEASSFMETNVYAHSLSTEISELYQEFIDDSRDYLYDLFQADQTKLVQTPVPSGTKVVLLDSYAKRKQTVLDVAAELAKEMRRYKVAAKDDR